ncbi:MAG: hypothetical protein CSB06_02375 [Bacteroidia bacterium]|nr:MAG: hypothetical protein CSB06_02375 [Bacteroidia bacterium]
MTLYFLGTKASANFFLTQIIRFVWVHLLQKKKKNRKLSFERKKLSIFAYQELTQPIPFSWGEHPLIHNNSYGLSYTLQKYARLKKIDRRLYFEHGAVIGPIFVNVPKETFANKIGVFGQERKELLQNRIDCPVLKTGPYIRYAPLLYSSKKMDAMKQELGRTLLVFPAHSVKAVQAHFDIEKLIQDIQKKEKGFDSVLVCLHWQDIAAGREKEYLAAGYKIVTAGHINDLFFLSRLKTIIALADYTMSNSLGTHVPYCLAEGKPHLIIKQRAYYKKREDKEGKKYRKDLEKFEEKDKQASQKAINKISSHFEEYVPKITEDQKQTANYLWGLNETKTPEELRLLLQS